MNAICLCGTIEITFISNSRPYFWAPSSSRLYGLFLAASAAYIYDHPFHISFLVYCPYSSKPLKSTVTPNCQPSHFLFTHIHHLNPSDAYAHDYHHFRCRFQYRQLPCYCRLGMRRTSLWGQAGDEWWTHRQQRWRSEDKEPRGASCEWNGPKHLLQRGQIEGGTDRVQRCR